MTKTKTRQKVTVSAAIHAPVEKVWVYWTAPQHIVHWNFASQDWHTPHASNDLREGGKFSYRMEAKDGSMGFDFTGTYTKVLLNKQIQFILDDEREVRINLKQENELTLLTETFEAEDMNSITLQQAGWQSILNHFREYVESHG